MRYIKRDGGSPSRITGTSSIPQFAGQETVEETDTEYLAFTKAVENATRRNALIKKEFAKRITAVYPMTKQINIITDWLAGNNQEPFDAMRTFIDTLRSGSDALETSSALLSFDVLAALDITDNVHWSV